LFATLSTFRLLSFLRKSTAGANLFWKDWGQAGRSPISIRSKNWGTFRLFSSIRNRLIRLQGAYLRFLSCDIKSHWGAYLARVADQTPAKNPL
jgi:hypothetical protein